MECRARRTNGLTHVKLQQRRVRSAALDREELPRDELGDAVVHDENVGQHVPAGDLGVDPWRPSV